MSEIEFEMQDDRQAGTRIKVIGGGGAIGPMIGPAPSPIPNGPPSPALPCMAAGSKNIGMSEIKFEMQDDSRAGTRIKVIGVGNAIARMIGPAPSPIPNGSPSPAMPCMAAGSKNIGIRSGHPQAF